MEEYKELRISGNTINLKNNIVKSGILPQNSKELSRDIVINDDVEIEGGVFGNKINIAGGNVVFNGAVFANTEIHIENEIKDEVHFKKAVASADTIAAFVSEPNVIFYSDINAQKVRLKNCYIGGSVFAQEIYLENCVVLGGVFATKDLVIESSIYGTFHSPAVKLSGSNYMLYPACFSVEPISYLPNTELFNISLASLGSLFKEDKELPNTGKIKVNLEADNQRTVLVDDNDLSTIVNSYSVSGRVLAADVLDLEKLENHFLIEAGAMGSHVLKTYQLNKENGEKSIDLTVKNIKDFLFKILKGQIQIQELSGEIDFDEIKKIFS